MCIRFTPIQLGRYNSEGKLLPSKKSNGVKWSLIAAVAILATLILASIAVANLTLAGMAFASAGIVAGVFQLGGAILSGLLTVFMGLVAEQCIKNAIHHLKNNPLPPIKKERISTIFS